MQKVVGIISKKLARIKPTKCWAFIIKNRTLCVIYLGPDWWDARRTNIQKSKITTAVPTDCTISETYSSNPLLCV